MSEERGSLGTSLLLFMLGAAAGAVVVALTTPKTGSDLRSDIRDLTGKLRRKVREAGLSVCPVCGQKGDHEHAEAEAEPEA